MNECIKANFVDFRIQAYLIMENESEIPIQSPNIIFIDIDLPKDKDKEESLMQLEKTLAKTLMVIKKKLNGCRPTVL